MGMVFDDDGVVSAVIVSDYIFTVVFSHGTVCLSRQLEDGPLVTASYKRILDFLVLSGHCRLSDSVSQVHIYISSTK